MSSIRTSLAALAAVLGLAFPAVAQDSVAPFPDASRLVVIGGSLLEIVYALDEENKLVARDQTGIYPPEAAAPPDVGYMRALSPEGVLAVNPSALLVVEGSGPPEALDVLAKGSVPYVSVPERYSADGVLEKVRVVGAALGVPEKAEALSAELAGKLDAAETAVAAIPEADRKKVLFVISVEDGKIRAAGDHTAASAIITMAGGINPLAGMPGYQTLSDEAILTADPDFVLMMSNGARGDFSSELAANPALAATTALREGKVVQMDGAYLLGFGPRTPDAVLELAHHLYGDRVGAP